MVFFAYIFSIRAGYRHFPKTKSPPFSLFGGVFVMFSPIYPELRKLDQGPIDWFLIWIEVRSLYYKPLIFANPNFFRE